MTGPAFTPGAAFRLPLRAGGPSLHEAAVLLAALHGANAALGRADSEASRAAAWFRSCLAAVEAAGLDPRDAASPAELGL